MFNNPDALPLLVNASWITLGLIVALVAFLTLPKAIESSGVIVDRILDHQEAERKSERDVRELVSARSSAANEALSAAVDAMKANATIMTMTMQKACDLMDNKVADLNAKLTTAVGEAKLAGEERVKAQQELDKVKKRLTAVEADNEDLRKQLIAVEEDREKVSKERDELKERVEQQDKKIAEMRVEIDTLRNGTSKA